VTVLPVAMVDYVLMNLDTYPWHDLPDKTLKRAEDTVTITPAGRQALQFAVAAHAGPHLLLRRLFDQ
jgi:hypothetical protein